MWRRGSGQDADSRFPACITGDSHGNIRSMEMRSRLGALKKTLTEIGKVIDQVHREKATDMLAFELTEMENIFVILVAGSLIGLPSPPTIVSLELLPYLESELKVMVSRSDLSQDPLGALASLFDID